MSSGATVLMCEMCRDQWSVYFENSLIASNDQTHNVLLRCSGCGDLFQFKPDGRAAPYRVTDAGAKTEFPSYIGGDSV
jgi:hypothetical protein